MPYALFQPRSPFRSHNPPRLFAPPRPRYTTDDWAVAQLFHSYGWIVLSGGKASPPGSASRDDEGAHYDEEAYAMGGGDWTEQGEDGLDTWMEGEGEAEMEMETETGGEDNSEDEIDGDDEIDTHALADGEDATETSNDTGSSDDDAASGDAESSITRYASMLELHHTGITLEESIFQGAQVEQWVKWNIMWMADWTTDREVDLRYAN